MDAMNAALVLDQAQGQNWAIYNADCVDVMRGMPDASVGYSIFSPPFASLYTYSASPRDMGNARDYDEFVAQFRFAVAELYRVLKPGRLVSIHCMLLPTSKTNHGYIGLYDFRGDLIRLFQEYGFIFHSEVVIWKDPVTAMQRTKALGLLHKQIKKDSAMSRQGVPDYLVTMRKPGDNEEPVAHDNDSFPVELWQRYASPVWVTIGDPTGDGFCSVSEDIHPSDTLQYRSAREEADERHICPLQLEVIRRGIRLWSNPGDVVLSPFGGIGSEGVVAIEEGRKAVLAELKGSYFEQARKNLIEAERSQNAQPSLFGTPAQPSAK
jgi:DNA modification methylase